MFIFYDLIFLVIALFYLPLYLLKGKFHLGLLERFGWLPAGELPKQPIWLHAVSVGEVKAVEHLLKGLRRQFPEKKFIISTVTVTGNKVARLLIAKGDILTYLPLDISFIVNRVLRRIDPCLFIVAETEIWPNLISCLHKRMIPVISVNGRISDSSFAGYRLIRPVIRPILKKFSLYCVQTERDSQRLRQLGAEEARIKVTGNMKFDAAELRRDEAGAARCRQRLGLKDAERLFISASTHTKEEEKALRVFQALASSALPLRLLIAPRHPERSRQIERLILRHRLRPLRISQLGISPDAPAQRKVVFLLDTVGELNDYYPAADIVFVGGSLVKKGGHNILEPIAFGKATLCGPHMFNFRDVAELFLKEEAVIQVRDERELGSALQELLANPAKAALVAERGRAVLLANQGATERNICEIKNFCAKESPLCQSRI